MKNKLTSTFIIGSNTWSPAALRALCILCAVHAATMGVEVPAAAFTSVIVTCVPRTGKLISGPVIGGSNKTKLRYFSVHLTLCCDVGAYLHDCHGIYGTLLERDLACVYVTYYF